MSDVAPPPQIVIAIDGPAASGKSTVARRLADVLGFDFVSTGELYRAVAWLSLYDNEQNPEAASENQELRLGRLLDCYPPKTLFHNRSLLLRLGHLDPMPHLHDWHVAATVSAIAQIPEVRTRLVAMQRQLAAGRKIVMEGRDIGTVVFPQTPFKFFIDAAPEIRAARRQAQGRRDAVAERDQLDLSRPISPLLAAEDALHIDTSTLAIDEVLSLILNSLSNRGLIPMSGAQSNNSLAG